jgi:hypothetical protein
MSGILRAWLLLTVLALAGCGMTRVTAANKASAELATLPSERKPDLDAPARTNLGLLREGKTLHVGDDADVALDLFPKSLAAHAYEIHDLPKVFPSPPYSSKGWDSPSGEGFGEIVYNKQVAAAIWNRIFDDEKAADAVIAEYKTQTPYPATPAFGAEGLTYLFWEAKPQQRQMILKAPLSNGRFRLTIAIGDDSVLDGLGINKDGAWHDLRVLQRSKVTTKGG